MADMNFEEHCPCGASIKVSGFESRVVPQVQVWHRTHDKHANAIAKALADTKGKTYVWPWTSTFTTTNPSGASPGD